MHEHFLKEAIQLANDNVATGGQPFGAVVVLDGQIIGSGVNEMHLVHDVSKHAELTAIRQAQQQLQTDQLKGAVMYASGEPCAMCYTAMAFVGIQEAYYFNSVEQAKQFGLGLSKAIYEDLKGSRQLVQCVQLPISNVQDPMA